MEIEIITEYDGFQKLENDWQDLVRRSRFNSFTVTHPWLCLWWRAFGRQEQLKIITLRRGNELLAAAPLRLGLGRLRGLPVKTLSFLTNQHVPEIDFLVDQEHPEVLGTLLEAICGLGGWSLFYIENVPAQSPTWPVWQDFIDERDLIQACKQGLNSPYLLLEGGWEKYLPRLRKKFRRSLRNKANRLKKSGAVEIEEITTDFDSRYVEENIFGVSSRSWKAKYNKDLCANPGLKQFYRELTPLAAEQGWLRLWMLKLDGRVIAFEYHILYGREECAIRADFDEDYRQFTPGSCLDAEVVQRLFENEGIRYNMGGTDDYYKLNWTESCCDHRHGYVFRPSFYAQMLYHLEFSLIPFLRDKSMPRLLKNQFERSQLREIKDPRRDATG